MEKIKTVIDDKAQKEIAINTQITAYVMAFLGAALVGFYITYSLLSKTWASAFNIIIVVVGVILLVAGIFLERVVNKAYKESKNNPITTYSEFKDDCVVIETFRNGEKVSEDTVYYNTAKRYYVRKNYIYLIPEDRHMRFFTKSDELVEFMAKTGISKF